jgi:hypothetical protein
MIYNLKKIKKEKVNIYVKSKGDWGGWIALRIIISSSKGFFIILPLSL